MVEIKIADISILNLCNFSCEYCIANSVKEKPIVNENGYIKVLDPRYDARGNKTLLNSKRNNVPFENSIIRYKGKVLTSSQIEALSKIYKKGDNLDELLLKIKNVDRNNGMFDMTNPNIYKGIAPLIGLGSVANVHSKSKRKKNGNR
jgi:hypothetical protein